MRKCSACNKRTPPPNYKTCDHCRAYSKAFYEKTRTTRIAAGLCAGCGLVECNKGVQCETCKKLGRLKSKARYHRIPDDRCKACKNLRTDSGTICKDCRDRRREQEKRRLRDPVALAKKRASRRRSARKSYAINGPDGRGVRKHLVSLIADQDNRCWICDEALPSDHSLIHAHHKDPVANGGTSDYENLSAAHAPCNIALKDKTDHLPYRPWELHNELTNGFITDLS